VGLEVAGTLLQLLTYLPHTALAYMGVAFTNELWLVATRLAPAPIVLALVLLWLPKGRS
jgi:hypothetical protein